MKKLIVTADDYGMSKAVNDAIDAGNHYIDRIAEEEGGWDETTITHAKNCLKNNLEFKGVVKIDEIEARASRNSVNW